MTAPRARLSPEILSAYLDAYRRIGIKSYAAQAVGTSDSTIRDWIDKSRANPKDPRFTISDPLGEEPDVQFHEACDRIFPVVLDRLEDKLLELATGRHVEPIVYKGHIAYEQDFDADPLFDKESGTVYYPPKRDPITNEPIPLLVPRVSERGLMFALEKRHPNYKPKQEIDLTTGGKPIVVPEKRHDTEALLAEHGVGIVTVPKPEGAK